MSTVQETVSQENQYIGIDKWHDAGLTGKGVVVWNTEGIGGNHSATVSRRIKDSAPECTVLEASLSMASDNDQVLYSKTVYNGREYSTEDFIKELGVNIVTRSVGGGTATGKPESKFWNNLKEKYNLVFVNSAGNKGTDGFGGALPPDVAIYVAACNLVSGKPKRASYSSVGQEVDFITFTGVWSGTSFAAPYLAGMAALLKQKYGKGMTQTEIYEYLKGHCQDLGVEGKDIYHGWGVPILGEPKTIIKLKIGENKMTVDSREVQLDQPAILDKTTWRTLVPIRAIAEAFGAEVEWDQETQTITIVR